MRKKIVLIIILIIFVVLAFIAYNLLFAKVDYTYVYDGIISLSEKREMKLEKYIDKNSAYIFRNKNSWDSFSHDYVESGQIPEIKFDYGKEVIIIVNDVDDLKKGGHLYDVSEIRKEFLTLKISLKEKGRFSNMEGFSKKEKQKYIIVYKVNLGWFSGFYDSIGKVNYNKAKKNNE